MRMEASNAQPVSLQDIRASLRQLRRQGVQFVGQLGHDTRELIERRGRPLRDRVFELMDVRKLRTDVRQRAERAVKEVEARGEHAVAVLHDQLERLVAPVVKELKSATVEVEDLKQRIAQLERRLEKLAKEKAQKDQAA